eukprot:11218533-Lingulodinium_polyedra.AAC.1
MGPALRWAGVHRARKEPSRARVRNCCQRSAGRRPPGPTPTINLATPSRMYQLSATTAASWLGNLHATAAV